jgi:hypothetical protein
MATTSKALYRGLLTTGTLYTVPSGKTVVVTSIIVANTTASATTFSIGFGGYSAFETVAIAAKTSVVIDTKQVLNAGDIIDAGVGASFSCNIHINGVEIA